MKSSGVSPYIPDSLDMLALNGIVPYDVKAYIYDKPSALPLPNMPNDQFGHQTPNNSKSGKKGSKINKVFNTLGIAALLTAIGVAGTALVKKIILRRP